MLQFRCQLLLRVFVGICSLLQGLLACLLVDLNPVLLRIVIVLPVQLLIQLHENTDVEGNMTGIVLARCSLLSNTSRPQLNA